MTSIAYGGVEASSAPETKRSVLKRLAAVGKTAVWGAIITSPLTMPRGIEWLTQRMGLVSELTPDFKTFISVTVLGGLAIAGGAAYIADGRPTTDPETFVSTPAQEMELVDSTPLNEQPVENADMLR